MIRLEKYDALIHKTLIIYWLSCRDIDPNMAQDLPKTGYVAYQDNLPVAAAFIRTCEGTIAMIDSLVSNPHAKSHDRHYGINKIIEALIAYARARGVRQILSYTVDESTLKRSKSHGFVRLPHVLLGLDLGE